MDPLCPKCRHTVPAANSGPSGYRCDNCGHRWKADIGPPTTPEGTPAPPPPASSPPAGASEGWAVASLVCGLVFFIPLVTQILALVFGAVAFRRLPGGQGHSSPRIMAAAGMGCALLATVMWIWVGVSYLPFVRPGPAAAVPTTAPAGTPGALVRLGYATGYAGVSPSSHMLLGQVTEVHVKAKELLRGLAMYRQDHRRWPRAIDDLIPTYLSRGELRLDKTDAFGRDIESAESDEGLFKYLPPPPNSTTSEEKRILVYSMRLELDDGGNPLEVAKRWVIWSNNRIEFLEEESIAEALETTVDDLSIKP